MVSHTYICANRIGVRAAGGKREGVHLNEVMFIFPHFCAHLVLFILSISFELLFFYLCLFLLCTHCLIFFIRLNWCVFLFCFVVNTDLWGKKKIWRRSKTKCLMVLWYYIWRNITSKFQRRNNNNMKNKPCEYLLYWTRRWLNRI